MTSSTPITWTKVSALIASIAGVATIHGMVFVPAILNQAEIRAAELDQIVSDRGSAAMQAHLDWTENVRSKLVTQDEFKMLREELTRIHAQLDRIESTLSSK